MARPLVSLRVDPTELGRLDRLAAATSGADRTGVVREAMRRGLEALELEHASGRPVSLRLRGEDIGEADEETTMNETNGTSKAIKALAMIPALEAQIPLQPADAHALVELVKARAALETNYDAVEGGRAARTRLAQWRAAEAERKRCEADQKAIRDHDARLVAEAQAFERSQKAAAEARARGLMPPAEAASNGADK